MAFAPNASPAYSHRSERFSRLLRAIEADALRVAGVGPREWGVLVFPGSGTAALEAAIWTVTRSRLITPLFAELGGKFGRRLFDLCFVHDRVGLDGHSVAYVQYETSRAERNSSGWKAPGITIVDAVSAFPYYSFPSDADIVVTVAGKQLGCSPGLALVFYRRHPDVIAALTPDAPLTFLNLGQWVRYAEERAQTPVTMPIALCEELAQRLSAFDPVDRRSMIEARAQRVDALRGYCVRGEGPTRLVSPVPDDIARAFDLYAVSKDAGAYQLFLWSDTSETLINLLSALAEARHVNRP